MGQPDEPTARGYNEDEIRAAEEEFDALINAGLAAAAAVAAAAVAAEPIAATVSDATIAPALTVWNTYVAEVLVPALTRIFKGSAATFVDTAEPTLLALSYDLTDIAPIDEPAAAWMAEASNRLRAVSDIVWEEIRAQLVEGVQAGDGIPELAQRVMDAAGFSEPRARATARTEVAAASNGGSITQARALGLDMDKQWEATVPSDGRTRLTHIEANHQTVDLGAKFEVGDAFLDFPGDPTGQAEEVINCRCAVTFVNIRRRAEMPEVAAAATHTGAMIALVPSDADIKRLALDDGEPAEELHLTVMYLGDAADIDPEHQAAVHALCAEMAGELPPFSSDGFALNVFNPHTDERDTALVMGVGGDGLAELYGAMNVGVGRVFSVPKQHAPFAPHVTLAYSDDLGRLPDLVGRLGPVTFDRLRVAFGDEVTDYPLTGTVDDSTFDVEGWQAANSGKIRWSQPGAFRRCVRAVQGEVRDPEALCATLHHRATGKWPGEKSGMTVAAIAKGTPSPEQLAAQLAYEDLIAEAVPGAHFHTLMHTEGISTGRRVQMPGSLTYRNPPIPFNWQVESGMHGGQKKVVEVGLVSDIARHGTEIHGWGMLDLDNPIALEYARKLAAGWVRGVSVGMDEQPIEVEYLYSAANPDEVVQEIYLGGNVMEVTSSGGIAQESAYVEPLPALLEALAERGIEIAAAAEDCGCPDAVAPVS